VFGLDPAAVVPSDLEHSTLRAPRPRRTCLVSEKARHVLRVEAPSIGAALDRFARLEKNGYVNRLRTMVTA
jgi:hypothetical protein